MGTSALQSPTPTGYKPAGRPTLADGDADVTKPHPCRLQTSGTPHPCRRGRRRYKAPPLPVTNQRDAPPPSALLEAIRGGQRVGFPTSGTPHLHLHHSFIRGSHERRPILVIAVRNVS